MTISKYDPNKLYRTINITQYNYSFQLRRLEGDQKRAENILIYYSLALIILSLTAWYYVEVFDARWASFSGVILSTILLSYSILSGKADYSTRISKLQHALSDIKRLKRELGNGISKNEAEKYDDTDEYKSLRKEYEEIIKTAEARKEEDFFWTVRLIARMNGYSYYSAKLKNELLANDLDRDERMEIIGYIQELTPILMWIRISVKKIMHIVVYVIPFFVFLIGFNSKLLDLLIHIIMLVPFYK